jgi:CheY-like chemotaxis protein
MDSPRPILAVDDSQNDTDLLRRAFAQEHIANPLVICMTGREALAYLEHKPVPPALILLDIKMPGMSGFEVLTALKAHPEWRAIPVLIFSTSCHPQEVNHAFILGADSYLTKPLNNDELRAVLQSLPKRWPGIIATRGPHPSA